MSVEVAASATHHVVVGNREWMQRHDLVIHDDVHKTLEQQEFKGQLTTLCAVDGGCVILNSYLTMWFRKCQIAASDENVHGLLPIPYVVETLVS